MSPVSYAQIHRAQLELQSKAVLQNKQNKINKGENTQIYLLYQDRQGAKDRQGPLTVQVFRQHQEGL